MRVFWSVTESLITHYVQLEHRWRWPEGLRKRSTRLENYTAHQLREHHSSSSSATSAKSTHAPVSSQVETFGLDVTSRENCFDPHLVVVICVFVTRVYLCSITPRRTGQCGYDNVNVLTEVVTSIPARQPGLVWESYPLWHVLPCRWETQASSEVGPPVILINQSTFLPSH